MSYLDVHSAGAMVSRPRDVMPHLSWGRLPAMLAIMQAFNRSPPRLHYYGIRGVWSGLHGQREWLGIPDMGRDRTGGSARIAGGLHWRGGTGPCCCSDMRK